MYPSLSSSLHPLLRSFCPQLSSPFWFWCVCLLVVVPCAAVAERSGEELRTAFAAASLDDSLLEAGERLFAEAEGHIEARERAEEQIAALRTARAGWPDRIRVLEQALNSSPESNFEPWLRRLSAQAEVNTLERLLAGERATLESLRGEEERHSETLTTLLLDPVQSAGEAIARRQAIEEIDEIDADLEAAPDLIESIRTHRNQAYRERLEVELALLQLEQQTHDDRRRLTELELRDLQRNRQLHERRISHLQALIATRGETELTTLIRALKEVHEGLLSAAAPAPLPETAAVNLELGNELLERTQQLMRARTQLPELQRDRTDVENALRASTARIELGGSSEAVGRWLWSERRRLVTPARLNRQLDEVRGELADLKLREVVVAEELRQLQESPLSASGMAADQDIQRWLPLLESRGDLLRRLQDVLRRQASVLELTDEVIAGQHARTLEMRALLDRYLLWTRSHAVVDVAWFGRLFAGIGDLFHPERYAKTASLAWRHFLAHPLRWISAVLVLGVLVSLRRRAVEKIAAEAHFTHHIREDHYASTVRTLAWTIAAALPFPVLFCLSGLLLRQVGQPGNFSDSMGIGLLSMGAPFFFTQLIRFAAIERGLGHAHFRWRRSRRESLRRWMPAFNWIVLPLWFVVAMSSARNLDLAADVSARIASVFACACLAYGGWKLFAAGQVWVVRGIEIEPSFWRRVVRVTALVVPLLIGLLAVAGWVHSASVLLQAVLASVSAAVCIAILTGLLGRWMLLGERRLAWQRTQSRSESGAEAVHEGDGEVSLQQVNEQTGRLVRALRLTLIAVAVFFVWSEVLPAAGLLEDYALWHVQDVESPDGSPGLLPITAMDVLAGVLILLLTWASARNLPGFVEIGLTSRTTIDASVRYAITSILRYAIVIAGVLLGLSMFGMRWSQLQWMAAALTVGLGFGLQEIFANFVSGLILLFERPFRVGDVITVAEYTGTVNRIRTRATTIVDFDNREIVVPNKNFITGQLTNWTLTDTITRLTIKIGVDYGIDPALVHRLLLQAAFDVPEVLRAPEPRTWFLSFGASSLDFELRVFVGNVEDRLVVQNALHTRINELLLEHGIDIAYPNLNVNLRRLPDAST
jgi:potassium efflux system protein